MTDAGDRPTLSGVQFHTVRQLARAVAIPRLELAVERESGKASDRSVVLEGDELRLGSHPSNDLVINDPKVSRFHCRLSRGGSGWSLADNGSLNGTLLDGLRVRDADLPPGAWRFHGAGPRARLRGRGRGAHLVELR